MTDEPIDHAKRTTVAGGMAALLAACGPTPVAQRAESRVALHDAMKHLSDSGLTFLDSSGNRVSLAALQEQLSGNPYTVSFQFAACGDTCPITGAALGEVGRRPEYADVKHIVISTMPFFDREPVGHPSLDAALMSRSDGLRIGGANPNTIVLYPSINGEFPLDQLSDRIGALQTRYFDLPTAADPTIGHTGTLLVYDGQGKKHGEINRPYAITEELPTILDSIQPRGQAR